MKERTVGIMGAMPEETDEILHLLTDKEVHETGMRKYYTGKVNGISTVVVFSRWGKVAAASTATTLINQFNITELIFTGVAGAIDESLSIGDIVVGKKSFQHDMDARPLMNEFEIPLLGKTFFEDTTGKDKSLKNIIEKYFELCFKEIIPEATANKFKIIKPKVFHGDIASGDHFFSSKNAKDELSKRLPTVLCVEMEGASTAQVCYEHDIPCCIIRTISDSSDENSENDFPAFIKKIAGKYSAAIIKSIFDSFN